MTVFSGVNVPLSLGEKKSNRNFIFLKNVLKMVSIIFHIYFFLSQFSPISLSFLRSIFYFLLLQRFSWPPFKKLQEKLKKHFFKYLQFGAAAKWREKKERKRRRKLGIFIQLPLDTNDLKMKHSYITNITITIHNQDIKLWV